MKCPPDATDCFLTRGDVSAIVSSYPRPAWLFATVQQFQLAVGEFLSSSGTLDEYLAEFSARLPLPSNPVESLILEGLLAVASRKLRAETRLVNEAGDPAARVASLLRRECGKHWTLDAISHCVGRHRTLLTAEFRKAFGCSIHKFLTDVRIDAAKRLLLETDWKVEAIAVEVGYSSRRTFYGQFSLATGTTPAVFRSRRLT